MPRSSWKIPFVVGSLLKKVKTYPKHPSQIIKTWSRGSTILPQFIGLSFLVYSGRKFVSVSIKEEMVGHKFGEFVPTRTFYGHIGDKKIKKNS